MLSGAVFPSRNIEISNSEKLNFKLSHRKLHMKIRIKINEIVYKKSLGEKNP